MPDCAISPARIVEILSDALPFIQSFHAKTFVIKYGGNAMLDPALKAGFARDVALLRLVGMRPVVVHGGGPQITGLMQRLGLSSVFQRGLRVTDAATMGAVEMAVGQLNQSIVGLINQQGGKAIGLSGRDGHCIRVRKMMLPGAAGTTLDLGLVGDIERIEPEIFELYHTRNFIPVVMPIGVGADGEAYNLDADLVAGKLAETLRAERLILMTNQSGVLGAGGDPIAELSLGEIEALSATGVLHGGMLPKLEAAAAALRGGVKSAHVIDGRVPGALLLQVLTSEGLGTLIRAAHGPHFVDDSRRYLDTNAP